MIKTDSTLIFQDIIRTPKSKNTKKPVNKLKNVLQNSNKINKINNRKRNLKFEESEKINKNDEIKDKIEKMTQNLLNEDKKNIKYLTFSEFKEIEELNKIILKQINKSKKIVILTGAGISCNAGIPDFRSTNGLYNKKLTNIHKGKEMFDISVYRSLETVRIFNKFIYDLYQQVLNSKPTKTHEFIKKLHNKKKLIKCYTQNIDGLERECGLNTKFNFNEWNETDVIQLHGDLHELCCNSCNEQFKWNEIFKFEGNLIKSKMNERIINEDSEEDLEEESNEDLMILSQTSNISNSSLYSFNEDTNNNNINFSSQESLQEFEEEILIEEEIIECPKCINQYENKLKLGKRCLESSIGIIRPNIVLYGEEHPYSDKFAKNLNKDLNKRPNLLLIFGTSLKVNGVKNLVKNISKKIHENENGLVILINKEPISNSFWKNYIDYQIVSDCDSFCEFIESKLPKVFE